MIRYDSHEASIGAKASARDLPIVVAAAFIGDAVRLHGHADSVNIDGGCRIKTEEFFDGKFANGPIPHRLTFTVKGATLEELRQAWRDSRKSHRR